MTKWAVLAVVSVALGCGESKSGGTCNPVGFTSCDGNDLVSCVGSTGAASGTTEYKDCALDGLACVEQVGQTTIASCAKPTVAGLCYKKDARSCTANEEIVRCVWASEQPIPNTQGDLGAWRVVNACKDESQVCKATTGSPTCG